MSYFPFSNYIPNIERIHNIIPSDRNITKEEILSLTNEDIISLQIYFFYTTPSLLNTNDYKCLGYILKLCRKVLQSLEDNSVVIAPGDSPSKIIQIINMLYRVGKDTYMYKGEEKHIRFITFPISGLSTKVDISALDEYFTQILLQNNVNLYGSC